jgi:hypothetical protein
VTLVAPQITCSILLEVGTTKLVEWIVLLDELECHVNLLGHNADGTISTSQCTFDGSFELTRLILVEPVPVFHLQLLVIEMLGIGCAVFI